MGNAKERCRLVQRLDAILDEFRDFLDKLRAAKDRAVEEACAEARAAQMPSSVDIDAAQAAT